MIGASMAVRPPRSRGPVLMMIDALRRIGGNLWMVENAFSGAFVDNVGTQPVTAYADLLGLTTDRLGVVGPERKQDFVTGVDGTASAAAYNTTTGVGSVTRVDVSNQSYVRITGLTAAASYRLSITNTGAVVINVRQTNSGGVIITNIAVGATSPVVFTGNSVCVITSSGGTSTFVLNSFTELTGNHATQSAVASKPSVQRVPKRTKGPVNQLLWSGDFSNAAWDGFSPAFTRTLYAYAGPNGDAAWRITATATPGVPIIQQVATATSVTLAVAYKAGTFNPNGWLVRNVTTSTNLTATTTSVGLPNGWALLSVVVTSGITIGNTLSLYFGAASGVAAGLYWFLHRGALFDGAYTAQQIIDNGGIPLTTTQPLPNVTEWANVISFADNDFLQTGITTGNEGFVAAAVTFGGAAASVETVMSSGANGSTIKGVWLTRVGSVAENTLWLATGNGTTRNIAAKTDVALRNTPRVVAGGWTATTCFAAVDGVESANARLGDMTPAPSTLQFGSVAATVFMQGPMHAIVYSVAYPDAATRKVIYDGLAALQGRTL